MRRGSGSHWRSWQFRGNLIRRAEARREVMKEGSRSVCPGNGSSAPGFGQLSNHPSIFRNEPLAQIWRYPQYEGMEGNRHLLSVLFAVAFATLARAQLFTTAEGFGSSFRDTDAGWIARENISRFRWEPETFERVVNSDLVESDPAGFGGVLSLPGTLNPMETVDTFSGSQNLFLGFNGRVALSLSLPTRGVPGIAGFTGIFIQGLMLEGSPALFSTFVLGWSVNVSPPNQAQAECWIGHEILGDREVYSLNVSLTSFGADAGQAVPEPSAWGLLLGSLALLAWFKRATISKSLLSIGVRIDEWPGRQVRRETIATNS
jgi:hypothetical protein